VSVMRAGVEGTLSAEDEGAPVAGG
jgi:hypothetical protein